MRYIVLISLLGIIASVGGYEQDMFGLVGLVVRLVIFGVMFVFAVIAAEEVR